jgi:hypothetical protein
MTKEQSQHLHNLLKSSNIETVASLSFNERSLNPEEIEEKINEVIKIRSKLSILGIRLKPRLEIGNPTFPALIRLGEVISLQTDTTLDCGLIDNGNIILDVYELENSENVSFDITNLNLEIQPDHTIWYFCVSIYNEEPIIVMNKVTVENLTKHLINRYSIEWFESQTDNKKLVKIFKEMMINFNHLTAIRDRVRSYTTQNLNNTLYGTNSDPTISKINTYCNTLGTMIENRNIDSLAELLGWKEVISIYNEILSTPLDKPSPNLSQLDIKLMTAIRRTMSTMYLNKAKQEYS